MATILIPPGMGDSYWSLTVLESLKKVEKLDSLDVYIYDIGDGLSRAIDYVRRHPFLDSVQYTDSSVYRMKHEDYFMKEQLSGDLRFSIIKDFKGFDYLVWFNGLMDRAVPVIEVFPEYKVNWYPRMTSSKKEDDYGKWARDKLGDYILASFTTRGHYAHWANVVSLKKWYGILLEIHRKTGCKIILTGRGWDIKDHKTMESYDKDKIFYNLTSQTSVDQLFGLIKNARAYIGYQMGNTMMSVLFHKQTFVIYNRYEHYPKDTAKVLNHQFHPDFYFRTLPPDTLNVYQTPIFIDENFNPDQIINHEVFS